MVLFSGVQVSLAYRIGAVETVGRCQMVPVESLDDEAVQQKWEADGGSGEVVGWHGRFQMLAANC